MTRPVRRECNLGNKTSDLTPPPSSWSPRHTLIGWWLSVLWLIQIYRITQTTQIQHLDFLSATKGIDQSNWWTKSHNFVHVWVFMHLTLKGDIYFDAPEKILLHFCFRLKEQQEDLKRVKLTKHTGENRKEQRNTKIFKIAFHLKRCRGNGALRYSPDNTQIIMYVVYSSN